MNKCQVKNCENETSYSYITHEDGDKEMCQECVDKYLPQFAAKADVTVDLRVPFTKSERLEQMMFELRYKVSVAKEAKEIGYGDDLFDYSIKSAEQLIIEMEEVIKGD